MTVETIIKDIQNCLNDGYNINDLNAVDRSDVLGFAWGILMTENAFDNIVADLDIEKTTIAKIKKEYIEEVWSEVYTRLVCDGTNLIYSLFEKPEYMEG